MSPQPCDEPFVPDFDDGDMESVFGSASPAETCAAVLTEARIVLPDIATPLDAELWGSDIVAALGARSAMALAIVPAAERAATLESLAVLRVLGAVGQAELRADASAAADRLAGTGMDEPAWAAAVGSPAVGECWRYSDAAGVQEAVTMSFRYGSKEHVVSVLIDNGQGGAIQDVWIGDSGDVLERTRQMSVQDPQMTFELITPQAARARMDRAFAAGECPRQPAELSNVASRRAVLRARIALLPQKSRTD